MKFDFIRSNRETFEVSRMCVVLGVSRSGYYRWLNSRASERRMSDKKLLEEINAIFKDFRGIYGSPRVWDELLKRGRRCSRKRVARLMREAGLQAKASRKYKPKTTQSDHGNRVSPNLLPEASIDAPNQAWAADITYVRTDKGWVYLATIIDLYSRMIVGWAARETITSALVKEALTMALKRREAPKLHHSDRGSQYASQSYRRELERHGITSSMSRKGNCYDNATQESFFHSLKQEHVFHERFRDVDHARSSLFDYIEVFYNRKRSHSSLGYLSPAEFERRAATA